MTLNDMEDGDVLTVGKTIQISIRNVPVPKPITAPYTVKAGDTLHAIADKQGVSGAGLSGWTSLVLELNGLASADMLAEGQLLQLPVTSGSNTSTASSTSSSTSSSSSSGPSSTSQNVSLTRPATTTTYVVKAGDTLEAIGIAQKVSETQLRGWIEDVRKLNKLNEDAFITEGQKLELPSLSVTPPASSTTTTTTTTTSESTTTTADPPRPPAAPSSVSSTSVVPNTTTMTTPSTTSSSTTTNSTLQNAPRSMTGCFYVIKPEDDLPGIARKVGIASSGVSAWIAQVKQLNGVDFKVMPVGTAIQMPC